MCVSNKERLGQLEGHQPPSNWTIKCRKACASGREESVSSKRP